MATQTSISNKTSSQRKAKTKIDVEKILEEVCALIVLEVSHVPSRLKLCTVTQGGAVTSSSNRMRGRLAVRAVNDRTYKYVQYDEKQQARTITAT